jgi:transposase
MIVDKKEKKAIRMKILDLLDKDPDNPEIQRLSNLLKKDKKDETGKVIERGYKRKFVDPEKYIELRNQNFTMNEIADFFGCSIKLLISEVSILRSQGLIKKGDTKAGRQRIKLTKEQYLKFKKDGLSDLEIAREIDAHPSSIKNFKRRCNIPDLRNTTEKITKEEYLLKKEQGLSDEKISNEYGVGRWTLYRKRKLWGITKKSYENKLITLEEYREMKSQLMPDYKIAKKFGFSRDTMINYKKRWGLM